jgi:hypothetical protein
MKTEVWDARIDYDAGPGVREVVAAIGRTEDVKLSPDNRRLVILDYFAKKIFLFSIRIANGLSSPGVTLSDYSILSSTALKEPHGVAFVDNDHIIVCNRTADVCVFRLPVPGEHPRERTVTPLASIKGKGFLSAKVLSPGSVDCYKTAEDCYRFLICNNRWNAVTSHTIRLGDSIRIRNEGILLEERLRIPDGISISGDTAWIAISNHVDGEILMYRRTPELNRTTSPTANLRGIVCPHGVRFTADGKVLVADAASQYLHVFEPGAGGWSGVRGPSRSIRLVDDKTFYAGRYDSREGGVKGLDLDNAQRVLITTHKLDVLAFHDLGRLLSGSSLVDAAEMAEFCRERDRSLQEHKNQVVNRRWTLQARAGQRWSNFVRRRREQKKALRAWLKKCRLSLRNRWSNESLLDPSGPVISMTTHPSRRNLVSHAIESIARGTRKPSSLHLWITDEKFCLHLPPALLRLKARGLEIHFTENLGPHTKYYPYVKGESEFDRPLVTADDDIMYPRDWLQKLIAGYEADPAAIHCFRAHRIRMNGAQLAPYNSWHHCEDTVPSHLNFLTGVSGVIYPPGYLNYLKRQGDAFRQCCPHADDIWLTIVALRGGFKVAQLENRRRYFATIPHSQKKRLYDLNVIMGGNQIQLMKTLSEVDLSALHHHQKALETGLSRAPASSLFPDS